MEVRVEPLTADSARQICLWDTKFSAIDNQKYRDILDYLETDSMQDYILEHYIVPNTSPSRGLYSVYGVEKRYAYVLRDKSGDVAAFTFFFLTDIVGESGYDVYLQSIAVNPEYRGKGLGRKLLSDIIINDKKYINEDIKRISAAVDFRNIESQKLFGLMGMRKRHQIKHYCFMGGDFEVVKENLIMLQGVDEM